MNVVDSSGWLEYVAGTPSASFFAPAIENTAELIVPVITLYEVYKRIVQQCRNYRTVILNLIQDPPKPLNAKGPK